MAVLAEDSGTLFVVSGPSGAGKDALIDAARRRLAGETRLVFPLRTITRPDAQEGEIHVTVTPAQFDRLRRQGAFTLYWGSRGVNYAVPASIDQDLLAGRSVVVNLPPAMIAEAVARYANVLPVWVTARPALRRRRLLGRGRETPAEIEQRLRASDEPPVDIEAEILVNEAGLASAALRFSAILAGRLNALPIPAGRGLGLTGRL